MKGTFFFNNNTTRQAQPASCFRAPSATDTSSMSVIMLGTASAVSFLISLVVSVLFLNIAMIRLLIVPVVLIVILAVMVRNRFFPEKAMLKQNASAA